MATKDILQNIFSVKNEYGEHNCHKVINILGIKVKLKNNKKKTRYASNKKIKSTYAYTTTHYVISMLKAYGIKNIVMSPGTQNAGFNMIVQNDTFFKCFSVVDERSAAYIATGIAYETGEPVVITCTGATASRNYISALTEAFYRKLPIIALTFFNYNSNQYIVAPQYVNRQISQCDIKAIDVELPRIFDSADKSRCLTFLNAALSTAKYKNEPVHINCPSILDFKIIDELCSLPVDIWKTEIFYNDFKHLKKYLKNKRIAIFIGSHHKFNIETQDAISDFAKSYCAPVFCDHTSHYFGENKILISQAAISINAEFKPEIVIDIGGICGNYSHFGLISKSEIWRVNEDLVFKNRDAYPVKYSFMCSEQFFFKTMNETNIIQDSYYNKIKKNLIPIKLPDEFPLSMPLAAHNLSKFLPKNCSLHVAILNSLRGVNYFDFDKTIDINCNVGGFGIDGPVSTLVGQSLANPDKKCFGLIGDLAFFYDMNAIGNRDIKNNLRILVINNSLGEEMYIGPISNTPSLLPKTLPYVCAQGHYTNGAKGWSESCGFEYFSANSKDEFLNLINDFCNKDFEKPVLFEVFTDKDNESNALKMIRNLKSI